MATRQHITRAQLDQLHAQMIQDVLASPIYKPGKCELCEVENSTDTMHDAGGVVLLVCGGCKQQFGEEKQ